MGRGLGFKQRPENIIDENLIEKQFFSVHLIKKIFQSLNY
ncbi:CAT RNA binding domain-containing protein [Ligilactobacillus salivarius]